MADPDVDLEAGSAEEPLLEQPPRKLYPDPFYCPITNEVMIEPVVAIDGHSFEKSAVLKRDADAGDIKNKRTPTYYPNRALQAIIEKEKCRVEGQDTVRGALERAEETVRSNFLQILDKSVLPTDPPHALPDAFYCSITLDLISRAAIDPEGNSYERQAVVGWILANHSSPLTREPLSAEQLRDNHALDDLIDAEANKSDGELHPSFRRWREARIEYSDRSQESKTAEAEGEERSPFPTSQEEIDELSSRNRPWKCTFGAVFFLILAVIFLILGVIPFEIVIFIVGISCVFWEE